MRVKLGGPATAADHEHEHEYKEEDGELSFSLSHLEADETTEAGDLFINFRGSVVSRIAARFEAGFGGAIETNEYVTSPLALLQRSCLKSPSSKSDNRKKILCSVSFSDAPQIFCVERFNDSYYEIEDYDDDDDDDDNKRPSAAATQSPKPRVQLQQFLPDDMFTPEETSPRKSVSSLSGHDSLPKPPLLSDDDDMETPPSPMTVVISLSRGCLQELTHEQIAAINIQRILRGWYQRLLYRIRWLEHQIATHDDRTRQSVHDIQQQTLRRKRKLKKTMTRDYEKQRKRELQTNTVARESQQIVAFLRKENNHLRDKIREFHDANQNLQRQNARIAGANGQSDEVVSALQEYSERQQLDHERLLASIPEYRAAIELLQNALEDRERYCLAETKIKFAYRKTIAAIADKVNETMPYDELTEQVLNLAIQGDEESMSCLSDSWAGEVSYSQMLDSWGRRSFSQMSRRSLASGLSDSVAALQYESDSDDEDVKKYAESAAVATVL